LRSQQISRQLGDTTLDPDSANPPVLTETDGKFAFKEIDAGQYRLDAERNGYPTQPYGQKVAGGLGTIVNVAAGQSIKDVTFRLVQGCVVTGRVRDAAGEPIAGLGVSLMRSRYDELGKKTLVGVNQRDTDDRGEYRFFWVEPGRYYVMVTRAEGYRSPRVIEEPWAYHDKETLSRYEALGRSVRIQESSRETADLKIIPAPKP
jgi:hypothetical protein